MTFDEARAQFPVLDRYAYLQAGSVGPLARGTIEAVRGEEERGARAGTRQLRSGSWGCSRRARSSVRTSPRSSESRPEQVALTASTTDGCNIVLAGLDLHDGDEIITTTDEHFGLLGPLHTSGATVVVTDPDPERIVAAVTPRTRLIALSHVLWTTGAVLPVHELRASTGVPILVDGAQSVGAMPVDATGLDFYTISGQKWLCGPEGTGALVVADPDALRDRPPELPLAGRLRAGRSVRATGGCSAVRSEPHAGLGRRRAPGCDRARSRRGRSSGQPRWRSGSARGLQTSARTCVVPESRATLVSWRAPAEESATIVERLADAGVIVRDLPGRGLIRASVGWWTNDDDLERLVASL